MIRLHQTFGAHAGRTLAFDKDVVTLGRLPDSDVPFDPHADIDASGRHAELRREGGRWFVVDVGSRNGTYLDGERIQRAPLESGSVLEFGKGGPRLKVEILRPVGQAAGLPGAVIGGAQGDLRTPSCSSGLGGSGASGHAPWMPPAGSDASGSSLRSPVPVASPAGPAAVPPSVTPTTPAPYTTGGVDGRVTGLAPARRRAPGLGLAWLVVAVAGAFAAVGVGVLVWRLRGGEPASTAPGVAVDLQPRLPHASAAATLTAAVGPATYLVVARAAGDPGFAGLCNAFAVRSDVLATTARCVMAAQRARAAGFTVLALQERADPVVPIVGLYYHPLYRVDAGEGPDLGVFTTASVLTTLVSVPAPSALRASLAVGGSVFVVHRPYDPASAPALPIVPAPLATQGMLLPTATAGATGGWTWAERHTAAVANRAAGAPVLDGGGMLLGLQAGDSGGEAAVFVRADVIAALVAGLAFR
jgi:hypothetical protein